MYDVHSSLKLYFVLIGSLNRTGSTSAALRPTIAPHKVIASPSDAGIEPVDILAARGQLGGYGLQDAIQFFDEISNVAFFGVYVLRCNVLQARSTVLPDCSSDFEGFAVQGLGDGVDGIRGWGRKTSGDSYIR